MQEKRAALARDYFRHHRIFPSWAIMFALTQPPVAAPRPATCLFPHGADWEHFRRRVVYPWLHYIAYRNVEYAENMDAIAEAAGRPRRRLDPSVLADSSRADARGVDDDDGDYGELGLDAQPTHERTPRHLIKSAS